MRHNTNNLKPDDRGDNIAKLNQAIDDTQENMEEAEETMEFSSKREQKNIKAKNKRRKEAIEGMYEEIADEEENQQD